MSRSKAHLSEFASSPFHKVRVHPQNEQFAYSDGQEVEARILQTLQGTKDLSVASQELMARIQDWPTEYHFTDTRANLLRHLPIGPNMRALELGAGCGAITRYLGEQGCEVVAVEGSLLRARCARERTRDLENVSVFCANFQDVAFAREFDLVTLIGVLEYAPMFFDGDDPIGACLAVARSAVAPGGTLIVAIENQLGLKYFAGATEDHLGTHFSGIENRYRPDGVRTLGRRRIEQALQAAGFREVAFQYPFPDYKLPVAIVFEAALGREDFRPSEIVRHLYARDYAGKDLRFIDASQVWPVLDVNGLLGPMSNSFLILAREEADRQTGGARDDLLVLTYSAGRAPRFQTRTAFRAAPGGAIACEKTWLYPAAALQQPSPPGLTHRLTRDTYLRGPTLHSTITAALRAGDSQQLMALLGRWLDFLGTVAGTGESRVWEARLPGEFWDCTPTNLIECQEGLHYFDAEWVTEPGPTVSSLLLRYLFGLGFADATGPDFRACFQATYSAPAIRALLADLGLVLTEEILNEFARDSNEKNAIVFPLKPPVVLDSRNFFLDLAAPRAEPQPASGDGFVSRVFRGLSRVFAR
jgi:cyclopropane fatty-acyl-phospholipid synthase-like methyltransferase